MATVLVIEDNILARTMLVDLLKGAGHTVFEAEDWITTVETLRKHTVSVMVLDVNLPGLSGDTIARLLRQQSGLLPKILVHSGLPQEELEPLAESIQASGYLEKGVPDAVILGAIARAHAEFEKESLGTANRPVLSSPPLPKPPVSSPPIRSLADSAPPAKPTLSRPPSPSRSFGAIQGKVLVVDSDPDSKALAQDLLSRAGLSVELVSEWVGVTQKLFECDFDLVLLDTSQGIEMVRMLQETKSNCPPILLWGDSSLKELQDLANESAADGYVQKSRAAVRLVRKVQLAIRS